MFKPQTALQATAFLARLSLLTCSALLVDSAVREIWPGPGSTLAAAETGQAANNAQATPAEPLHQRIDRAIEQAAVGPLAPLCNDADFVRRIYLDLTGVIPTAQRAESFLADDSADKRDRLIDTLLESPEFTRHFAMQLDVMLMERRADRFVDQAAWEAYLIESVAREKPLDRIFKELVYPEAFADDVTPARKFLLNRDAEPHAMTRDVGRMLFGMDLQCAQCHDHPLVDDYYQADYYGLHAFLKRTSRFDDPADKAAKLSERAEGEASFESVFTGDGQAITRPRLPKGATLYVEPTFSAEGAYLVNPDDKHAGKPAYSRRQALINMLADSPPFRRNLANRLWTMVMGRGLVHPTDFHYLDNPPVNPRLLSMLADDIAANGFDLRYAIREMTLSKTYQRSCEPARPETLNLADIQARLDLLTQQRETLSADIDRLQKETANSRTIWLAAVDANDQVDAKLPPLQERLTKARQMTEQAEKGQAEAKQGHQEELNRAQVLEPVLVAARTAKQELDDEPVLADSLAMLERRSKELLASVAATASNVQQKTATLDAARQEVSTLQHEVDALVARRIDPEELTRQEQSHLDADSAFANAYAGLRLADTQIKLCEAILGLPSLWSSEPSKAEATWKSIVDRWTLQGQVAALKPLTSEQLALSTMRATGFLERTEAAAKAKIEKEPPKELETAGMSESEKAQVRESAVQAEMLNQLRGSVNQFIEQFGGLAGEEFQATVNQALFLGNGPTLNDWLAPAADTLVGRLKDVAEPQQLTDQLTLAVFSRPATLGEERDIAAFLDMTTGEEANDRSAAVAELVWAMVTSNEFRFNH